MDNKRIRGLCLRNGTYHINKVVRGVRLCKSLKTSDYEVACTLFNKEISILKETRASEEWRWSVEQMLACKTSWLHIRLKKLHIRGVANGKGCTLTTGEFAKILLYCNGVCAVTGIPFSNDVPEGAKWAPFSMSVDRIDSKQGYHYENCRIVCLLVNLAMNNWGASAMVRVAKAMLLKELKC